MLDSGVRAGRAGSIATFAFAAIVAVPAFLAVGLGDLSAEGLTRSASVRVAQSNDMPPGDVPGGGAEGSDAGAMVVRLERLENQLRAANGAIEELQNQQHRLEEQLKRFQTDVEFRFTNGHGGGGAPIVEGQPPVAAPAPVAAKPGKHSDAFDPNADPNAIGAPRPLGTTTPSPPLANPPGAVNAPGAVTAPLQLSRNNPDAASGPAPPTPNVIPGIGGPPDDPHEQFNAALETYRGGQYEQAEQQFRAFLAKNASNRLAADAIFYIGESYFQRQRPREAAEQYLKLSTDYAKSSRAPEGMLRLGQSLAALGNNDQACATFGEVGRRYPTAASAVKKGIEREMLKDHC
jgi:tol-pal system protein YbgF